MGIEKQLVISISMDDCLITGYLKKIDDYLKEEFHKADKILV